MTNSKSSTILEDVPSTKHFQAFERAREAVNSLLTLRAVLSPAEIETLEILLDKENIARLSQSFKEADEGKLEPIENILK